MESDVVFARAEEELLELLGSLGHVEESFASIKLSDGELDPNRALTVVAPRPVQRSDEPACFDPSDVRGVLAELGFCTTGPEIPAGVIDAADRLLISHVDTPAGDRRGKVYFAGSAPRWVPELTDAWMLRGVQRGGLVVPRYVAWKWRTGSSDGSERAVYWAALGGAKTIDDALARVSRDAGSAWSHSVTALLATCGVDGPGPPGKEDLLALDDQGRVAVDLLIADCPGRSPRADIEPDVAELCAAADLAAVDVEAIVDLVRGRGLGRLIVGIDGGGRRFVTFYGPGSPDRDG